MSEYRVEELMVPLSEYATVPEGSTLFDAVLALEKAQEEFDHTKYKHRGVLILGKDKRVIGKLVNWMCCEPLNRKMRIRAKWTNSANLVSVLILSTNCVSSCG